MPTDFYSRLPERWESPDGQVFRRVGRHTEECVDFDVWDTLCRGCGKEHTFLLRSDRSESDVRIITKCCHTMCRKCRLELAL